MKRGLVVAALALAACGRTVSEDDCKRIGDNLESVWMAESKKIAPGEGAAVDKANAVIKSEGEKVQADWAAQCKKELIGRRVDPKEVECLESAKSIDAINKCQEL